MKHIRVFLAENFHFLVVKFSVYLNRHVFVMVILYRIISSESTQRCPFENFFSYIISKNILEKEFTRGITYFLFLTKNLPNVL